MKSSTDASPRQTYCLDDGWKFHLGDIPAPVANNHLAAYMANKAGYARGAARPGFEDGDWPTVDLPHDWAIHGEVSKDHHVDSGFRARGIGWYRRHFELSEADRGKSVRLRFDGIASAATVYVNGHRVGRHFDGYTPFEADLTAIVNFGDDTNTIAVFVDATTMEGWWYEGAGIYRHAWLIVAGQPYIVSDSIAVRPLRAESGRWSLSVVAEWNRVSQSESLRHRLLDDRDATVMEWVGGATIEVETPRLWDIDSPTLYRVETTLLADGIATDRVTTTFGFRTFRFDADRGFFLNDRPLKLLGTCNHQDHGGLGVALPDEVQLYRVRRLKSLGSNAYRCAHGAPTPELLEACDRVGLLVIDENRNFGTSVEHLQQIRALVRRDRNHPSVIAWSICNEEAIQGTPASRTIAKVMADVVREEDTSRPITAAISGGLLNDDCSIDELDVIGINYQPQSLDSLHAKRPLLPIVGSENDCTLVTRGAATTTEVHFADVPAETVQWGQLPETTRAIILTRPFVAGLFIWTGFDYLGEPSPREWPCTSSHWGLLDRCGFEKSLALDHKAKWSPGEVVELSPYALTNAAMLPVSAYTSGDAAELFADGRSLGRKLIDPLASAPSWRVEPRASVLELVGFRAGNEIGRKTICAAGPPARLELHLPPEAEVQARCWPLTVRVVDAAGRLVASDCRVFRVTTDGGTRLLGVCNGDPASHAAEDGPTGTLFHGLAQVIIAATANGVVTVEAEGVEPASLRLTPAGDQQLRLASVRRRLWLSDWTMSPVTAEPIDPLAAADGSDMNSWERVTPGGPQHRWTDRGGFAIYAAATTPPVDIQLRGGRLRFRRLGGEPRLFIDGVGVPAELHADGAWVAAVAPGAGKRSFRLQITASTSVAGLLGRVELLPALSHPPTLLDETRQGRSGDSPVPG